MSRYTLDAKTVLITGGTGSFGQAIGTDDPRAVQPDEGHHLQPRRAQAVRDAASPPFADRHDVMRWFIGDVRDEARLRRAMEGVDVVIHAAALKQVPAAEYNPFEAVKTNILGAENVIDASIDSGVSRVVALSTDKAAAPINLYGATKLASDKLFVAANNYRGRHDIALLGRALRQRHGQPGLGDPVLPRSAAAAACCPITDERMTRFNITLQEGVDFVLDCLDRMWGGEIFVPRIPSYRILDVAEAMAPDAEIKIVGIRPGEKLHEEMITSHGLALHDRVRRLLRDPSRPHRNGTSIASARRADQPRAGVASPTSATTAERTTTSSPSTSCVI